MDSKGPQFGNSDLTNPQHLRPVELLGLSETCEELSSGFDLEQVHNKCELLTIIFE